MPSMFEELQARYAAACEAYAAAARTYVDAAVELGALDDVLSNANTPGHHQGGFGGQPAVLSHPHALPELARILNDVAGRRAARRDEVLAEVGAT